MSPAYFEAIDTADIESNIDFCVDFIGEQIYRYCTDRREALALQQRLQSLGGSSIEREAAFIYAIPYDMDEAVQELEREGFSWEEVV